MDPRIPCFLRTNRRCWGLTQDDVAFLLGGFCRSYVSRHENSSRPPSSRVLIGCEIIFSKSPAELFPAYYTGVEEEVVHRAHELFQALDASNPDHAAQRALLLSIASRRRLSDQGDAL
jgi:transcriptional regulator with XRE-family HTH domain